MNGGVNSAFTHVAYSGRDSVLRHALSLDGATHTSKGRVIRGPFFLPPTRVAARGS